MAVGDTAVKMSRYPLILGATESLVDWLKAGPKATHIYLIDKDPAIADKFEWDVICRAAIEHATINTTIDTRSVFALLHPAGSTDDLVEMGGTAVANRHRLRKLLRLSTAKKGTLRSRLADLWTFIADAAKGNTHVTLTIFTARGFDDEGTSLFDELRMCEADAIVVRCVGTSTEAADWWVECGAEHKLGINVVQSWAVEADRVRKLNPWISLTRFVHALFENDGLPHPLRDISTRALAPNEKSAVCDAIWPSQGPAPIFYNPALKMRVPLIDRTASLRDSGCNRSNAVAFVLWGLGWLVPLAVLFYQTRVSSMTST